ncbi:aldehyde dehydrogenase (NADP(+)) [Salinactinospora qingdaonensis]|uniref:Aldehyde dehydrogenase (NADP(+)) n=1 Tax=Salinactinospora qingdaonensis TaxID=702744 RepID=A0ABP7F3Y0_9ACTN
MTDNAATIPDTSVAGLDSVMAAAADAASTFGALRPLDRAAMLRQVAATLDAAADELVPLAQHESHLPESRCRNELARTTFQFRLFADVLDEGSYLEVTIDSADSTWGMGPRPDIRRMLVPLGPVAVFGAANFPFAFSTAGGDTAAALAAGCPVIVKGHPGHPRLAARTGELVAKALHDAGAAEGVFAVVFGTKTGQRLVQHPQTKAVGFTGSASGGRALHDLAAARPDPIPFYGELGSLNPVFVTRAAAKARAGEILSGYADSFTLGVGQFCTKPGVVLLPEGTDLTAVTADVSQRPGAPMLNDAVSGGYIDRLANLTAHPSVEVLAQGSTEDAPWRPTLLRTNATALLLDQETLLAECFGPASLVATYTDEEQLIEAAESLVGQLTATVHAEEEDTAGVAPRLLAHLTEKAGRVLWNGWPTGVSVTHAMTHGGPYPATTSVLHTSVGTTALRRFLRPVSYQSVPHALLPEAVRDENPLGVPRRVNGALHLS